MPDAETVLREAAERHGWTIKELPAIPSEDGYIELRRGHVVLRAIVPREPPIAYDPWDALYQGIAILTMVEA